MLGRTLPRAALIASLGFWTASTASAQTVDRIDAPSFVETSLKAIASVSPSDRRGARNVVANQIDLLPNSMRAAAITSLVTKLKSDDTKPNNDILAILGDAPSSWATVSTKDDMGYLYQLLLKANDDTTKSLIDSALANAKGSYKDGIANFNSTWIPDLRSADPILNYVAQTFPKSRYAERASFYVGQLYSKEYLLQDPRDPQLLDRSNRAFESYIKRAEQGDFSRTEYLAAGYFNRGLNAWLAGNSDDAVQWLEKGKLKFSNSGLHPV